MPEKIILDCDPGHDDAVALLLAHGSPDIELLAVTTVMGNQTIEKVTRNALVHVRRGRDVVHEGKVATLKHFKDDVREMTMGQECGITFENWEEFQEGDVIEAFEMVQINA